MKGIYKITSPSGKCYIGQSIDIERRWNGYINSGAPEQPKLHRSLIKYGPDKHKFEIIEECTDLNRKERFYQEKFDTVNNGLNLRYTKTGDKSGTLSKETCSKMSKSKLGELNNMFGKSHSKETRDKISKKRKGWKAPQELKDRLSKQRKGVNKSEPHIKALSEAMSSNPNNVFNHNVTCPHCGRVGQKPNMKRWHFENCRERS